MTKNSKKKKITKALQLHKKEDIGRNISPTEIAEFLESFRLLASSQNASKSKLISLKIPEDLLLLFREKVKRRGLKYQTQIKNLMRQYVLKKDFI